MADFCLWGCAISQAMGHSPGDFIKAYEENISMQLIEALDASPLAQAIFGFSSKFPLFFGTAVRLLDELQLFVRSGDEKYFPSTPRQIGRKLTEITPALISLGYGVERSRGEERLIRLTAPHKSKTNDDNVKTSSSSDNSRHYDINDVRSRSKEPAGKQTGKPDFPSFDDFGEECL
jgi:hypothetical protein